MSLSGEPSTVDAAAVASASTPAPTLTSVSGSAAPAGGANLRLALILASIATAFFAGIVLKYIFFPVP
ncbi:MAG: cytochrome oxidase small assembly protein [Burkholderiaceae bacterium]